MQALLPVIDFDFECRIKVQLSEDVEDGEGKVVKKGAYIWSKEETQKMQDAKEKARVQLRAS